MYLFIIGNGFDLQHGLKTSYSDFFEFNGKTDKGMNFINSLDKFQNCSKEELWSDFEKNLGELSDKTVLEETEFRKNEFNNEFDYDPLDDSFITNHLLGEYYRPLIHFDDLLVNWINSIDITQITPNLYIEEYRKMFLQNEDAIFITFNYTKVLEDLYNINKNRILHIHGSTDDMPIMGHGKNLLYNYVVKSSDADDEFIKGIHGEFCYFYNSTRKNISKFKKTLISFIKSYNEKTVERIIVIGHSLGDVDFPYFRELNQIIPNLDWEITYFGDSDLKNKRNTLKKLNLNNAQLVQSITRDSLTHTKQPKN